MKKTFIDVLLELPADATLRDFLVSQHSLPVPSGFVWDGTWENNQPLVDAVKEWPDADARSQLIANLNASIQLGDPASKQAMFEAVVSDGAVLAGLALCRSDEHRSFWLYVNHPALFERGVDLDYWEHRGPQAQQYDLGIRRQPNGSEVALAGLCRTVEAFYQRKMQCGESSVAHWIERSPGVFLLSVHVKDSATLRLEFEGKALKRRVGHPNIQMVLEYALSTGVVRALVRGGAQYQKMLVDAFAEHVLGVKVSANKVKSPTLDLSMLRTGFDVPEAFEDGFSMVQLKALTLLSPDAALKIECTATQSSQQRSVHDLVQEKLPGLLDSHWTVTAAQINLYYPPEPGRTRAKVVTVEVTSKGRLNLHKFDAKLQAQLEGYLVSVGILHRGQTLNAQEVPPQADAEAATPVTEG